jgi:MoaA/NifB/PqqE/SkfB family radical SAM enzyme
MGVAYLPQGGTGQWGDSDLEGLSPAKFKPAKLHGRSQCHQMSAIAPTSRPAEPTMILWDLVGSCNLKCPSCPMGSMRGVNPKGFTSDELFFAILDKLKREFAHCRQLHFYNWTEPLLHPRIGDYCEAASQMGFHTHLSSNLNHLPDAEGILRSGIKTLRISLSGFTQPTYAIGHAGGDIEKVKVNMQRLAAARDATRSSARIHVYFHKYRHNLHELGLMESLARDLGFDFLADWAYLMPLEKVLVHVDGTLSESERAFADAHFVPRLEDGLRLMRDSGAATRPCELIEQLVLDHRGRARLCCATFDHRANDLGDYLQLDWRALQQSRYAHDTCSACMVCGAHAWFTNMSDPTLRAQVAALAERSLTVGADSEHGPAKAINHRGLSLPILESASTGNDALLNFA